MQCRDCNGTRETGFVKLWPDEFIGDLIYPTHCQEELQGAYDLPLEFEKPPVILDLGANIGSYLRFCKRRYPGCTVHCYEPDVSNFQLLKRTTEVFGMDNFTLNNVGVLNAHADLDLGMDEGTGINVLTSCEWSFARGGKKQKCHVIPASELPPADIIKVDTEGSEEPIFQSLFDAGKLNFKGVIFEYHSFEVGMKLVGLMNILKYKEVFREFSANNYGVFKFIKE